MIFIVISYDIRSNNRRFYILCAGCEDKVIRMGGINLRDESIFFV